MPCGCAMALWTFSQAYAPWLVQATCNLLDCMRRGESHATSHAAPGRHATSARRPPSGLRADTHNSNHLSNGLEGGSRSAGAISSRGGSAGAPCHAGDGDRTLAVGDAGADQGESCWAGAPLLAAAGASAQVRVQAIFRFAQG